MTLLLDHGSSPKAIPVKTYPREAMVEAMIGVRGDLVYIGSHELPFVELFKAIEVVLNDSNLLQQKNKLVFIQRIQGAVLGPSWEQRTRGIDRDNSSAIIVKSTASYDRNSDFHPAVKLGNLSLSLYDLLLTAEYVLTNTDLYEPNDPRLTFLDRMRSIKIPTTPSDNPVVTLSEPSPLAEARFGKSIASFRFL